MTASLNNKEDEEASQERIVTVSGTTKGCYQFTRALLNTIRANQDVAGYVYHCGHYGERRGSYPSHGSAAGGGGRSSHGPPGITTSGMGSSRRVREDSFGDRDTLHTTSLRVPGFGSARGGKPLLTSAVGGGAAGISLISQSTTLYIAVNDESVGAIMGKDGNKLRQVKSASGANVTVSQRGEYIEGTNQRLITIEGSALEAQTAFALLNDIIATQG